MIPIKVDLIKKAKRPGYAMKPEYITVHQTGNTAKGANAVMHNKYAQVAPNPSWHYTVDDHEAYQHLPLSENGWHAGDGTNGPATEVYRHRDLCQQRRQPGQSRGKRCLAGSETDPRGKNIESLPGLHEAALRLVWEKLPGADKGAKEWLE